MQIQMQPREAAYSPPPTILTTPATPVAEIGPLSIPEANKKPNATNPEYLKPIVYKPKDNKATTAPTTILDTLSHTSLQTSSVPPKKKELKKPFFAYHKLPLAIHDNKTSKTIHDCVPTRSLVAISGKTAEILDSNA